MQKWEVKKSSTSINSSHICELFDQIPVGITNNPCLGKRSANNVMHMYKYGIINPTIIYNSSTNFLKLK